MNKHIKLIGLVSIFSAFTACSTNHTIYTDVRSSPTFIPKTPESEDLKCFRVKLSENAPLTGVVITVEDFLDGSIPNSQHNGPLMDQGKFLFQHYLIQAIPNTEGIILDSFPLIFARNNRGTVGVDKYGVPKKQDLNTFGKYLMEKINKKRERPQSTTAEKNNKVSSLVYYKFQGVFTRNDGNAIYSGANNLNPEYRDSNGKANISITKSTSNKIMGLTVQLVDAVTNTVSDSQSFRVEYDTIRNRYRASLEYNNVGLSGNMSTTIVESSDSAQDALIRASALWAVNRMYDYQFVKPVQIAMKQNSCNKQGT